MSYRRLRKEYGLMTSTERLRDNSSMTKSLVIRKRSFMMRPSSLSDIVSCEVCNGRVLTNAPSRASYRKMISSIGVCGSFQMPKLSRNNAGMSISSRRVNGLSAAIRKRDMRSSAKHLSRLSVSYPTRYQRCCDSLR